MSTLQQVCYLLLSNEQRRKLPENMRITLQTNFKEKIVKCWRKSLKYRCKLIQHRLRHKKPVTKKCIALYLVNKLPKPISISSITIFLHDYFHNHNPNVELSEKQMDTVLSFFKKGLNRNAHYFFGGMEYMANKSTRLILSVEDTINILNVLDKAILLDMYVKL
tara:strand:+ start:1536 stop:2027 length:492 start_codon:yes stop_codon:yes gene_type:complete